MIGHSKKILKRFLPPGGLIVLLALVLIASPAYPQGPAGVNGPEGASEEAAGPTIADVFLGEELVYQIGFWIFENVAVCRVTLDRDGNGGYVATLMAETTGMVDSVIQHRKDVYTSELELSGDGRRFITKSFRKSVDINGEIRYGNTYVDYGNRVVTWISWGGSKEEKSGGAAFPEGYYPDDPLAAFYNFRAGAYGPARKGKDYRIPTFPKEDRIPEIFMRILTSEETKKRLRGKEQAGEYFAHVKIDKELFATGKGGLEIFFSDDLIPLKAVARDVAFFGDVRGSLVEVGVETEFEKKGMKGANDAALVSGPEYPAP